MSNLGFQTVYGLFNAQPDVVCERVFLAEGHDGRSQPTVALESGRPLLDFDIIAFSLSFENDYANTLTILEEAGIPARACDRSDTLPLVIAGGVACQLDPEPLAPFMDCFLIGEAEILIPTLLEHFDPGQARQAQLRRWARNVAGAYVPVFYHPTYTSDGLLATFDPIEDVPSRINRVYLHDLSQSATTTRVLTPETVFGRTFLIEVSRGCPHGCRFCSAGYVYRPYRCRPIGLLEECLASARLRTEKIGLVGAAVSDFPDIDVLCRQALGEKTRMSFSSLRADGLTPDMVSVLRKSGAKTATIAPDAGSQRMREVINKGIDEADILNATEVLVGSGILNLRLYFMVGLPTETTDDVDAIVALCRRIKHRFLASSRRQGKMGEITISLSPFVPKPFTPFQWASMAGMVELREKTDRVRAGLRGIANVRLHADTPRWAYTQAVLSRGNRRTAELLATAHCAGGSWTKVFKAFPQEIDSFARRQRSFDELLPWDFINHGISKAFLRQEYESALQGETSPPCDTRSCTICGVCEKRA